jgi:hypothetical protein
MTQGNGHTPGEFAYIEDEFSDLTSPDIGVLERADPDTQWGMLARSTARNERYVRRILAVQSQVVEVVNAHSVALSSIKRMQHMALMKNAGLVTVAVIVLEVLKRIGIIK